MDDVVAGVSAAELRTGLAVVAAELRDLRRFAELSALQWYADYGDRYPDPGDELGHMCWQWLKQNDVIPLDERDLEYERAT
jgi:hypothetical protein